MAVFVAPKTWTLNEVFKSTDWNALTAAIAASINSIDNAQVSAAAAISGSKLATGAVTTAKINSVAVSIDKVAVGSFFTDIQSDLDESVQNVTGAGGETVIASATITISAREGLMLVFASYAGFAERDSGSPERDVNMRLKRSGGPTLQTLTHTIRADVDGKSPFGGLLFATELGSVPGAGAETYQVTMEIEGANANDSTTVSGIGLQVVEMA